MYSLIELYARGFDLTFAYAVTTAGEAIVMPKEARRTTSQHFIVSELIMDFVPKRSLAIDL